MKLDHPVAPQQHQGQHSLRTLRTFEFACAVRGIEYLTLFAFSSENWRRPKDEVSFLMQLFIKSLKGEIERIHRNNIRLRVVGDLSRFDKPLVDMVRESEALTAGNTAMNLTICANYGGRWDIMQAVEKMLAARPEARDGFSEDDLSAHLALSFGPEPDLFIRTGGEKRISNFMLWQLAYSELYFTDKLWPEFGEAELKEAIASYQGRERRYGRTSEQVLAATSTDPSAPGHA